MDFSNPIQSVFKELKHNKETQKKGMKKARNRIVRPGLAVLK
jgi:hypothetical protein